MQATCAVPDDRGTVPSLPWMKNDAALEQNLHFASVYGVGLVWRV